MDTVAGVDIAVFTVAAARCTLADIYGWFTEGFDTADLREAKALLETIA